MLDGLISLPWWGYILVALGLTHVTIASVTIFLHRHQAHRALDLHPAVAHFFRLWLWLTTGMVTSEWVSIHRKHHAYCETEADPHSPQVKGLGEVLWRGAELYRAELGNRETLQKYGHGTPDDWLERSVYLGRRNIGVSLMLVLDLLLFGPIGITIWAVQMAWIPFTAAGVINGLGHAWGYRNFETEDASTNLLPWGILIGGEELHNNHHAFASSARLSSKWWEFDIGWFYIRILAALGLATVRKVAPTGGFVPGKALPDMETLKAVVTNRLQVMAQYANQVVRSVHADELRSATGSKRDLLKPARRLLVRPDARLSVDARKRLQRVLEQSVALDTVYRFRLRLQSIWEQRGVSQEKLLQALQDWCRQAEATGIRSLQEFATHLRGYTLMPPATA